MDSPLALIWEGAWFALGFWPVYAALEALSYKIPAMLRIRKSRAAKLLTKGARDGRRVEKSEGTTQTDAKSLPVLPGAHSD